MLNTTQSESINFTEVFYGLKHELRSPLSNIYRHTDWLLSDLPNNSQEELKDHLQRIHASVERALQLSEPILDIIQLEGMTPQYVKLDILSPIKEAVERARADGLITMHELTYHLPSPTPQVQIDAVSIVKVFSILIRHIISFTTQEKISISVTTADSHIVITVGEGDPQSFQPKQSIELAGERTKGRFALELLLCNRLVSLHRGRFWASHAESDNKSIQLNFSLPVFTAST